jgi:hypothetical protein
VVKKNHLKNLGLKKRIYLQDMKKNPLLLVFFTFHALAKFRIKNVGWFKPRLANGKMSFLVTL